MYATPKPSPKMVPFPFPLAARPPGITSVWAASLRNREKGLPPLFYGDFLETPVNMSSSRILVKLAVLP